MYTAKYSGHPGLKTGTLKPTVKRSPEPHRQDGQVTMPTKLAHIADTDPTRQPMKRAHLGKGESIKRAHLCTVESDDSDEYSYQIYAFKDRRIKKTCTFRCSQTQKQTQTHTHTPK